MGALDYQLGFVDESTYGTGVTPTKFYEYSDEKIKAEFGRTAGGPLIKGAFAKRSDRFAPYATGATGAFTLDVMSKGFGYLFKKMMGTSATTGPTETTVYTHTATEAALTGAGSFFTAQLNRPFTPSGTNQVWNFLGGKVTEWELKNSVEETLVLDLSCDFQKVDTATPTLASASYPAGMENLTWAGGTVTIAAVQIDVTEFSIKGSNNLDVGRRFISGSTLKKEPTAGQREYEFSLKADYDSLTQYNRVASATAAGALAQIVAKWQGPTLLGTTVYPNVTVTIPAARFDEFEAYAENADGSIEQTLSGVGLYNGSALPGGSTVTIAYQSADVTI